MLTGGPVDQAAPADSAQAKGAPQFRGDGPGPRDKDNRAGSVAPTAAQRDAASDAGAKARWNRLGTPATLAAGKAPLAEGLPAEPVAAARAYIAGNRDVLGLTARAAAALDVVTSMPLGDGAVVLLQQRFGSLPAGHDGLISVGLRDGKVQHVTSSLARDAAQPAPATLTAAQANAAAARDAGLATSTVRSTRLVAVPTAQGARAAYEVLLMQGTGDEPTAYNTYVDARDGTVLVRDDLVDHSEDNPGWDVFPNSPPTDYSSTDTRQRWCTSPGAPGCDEAVGTSASPFAWDVKAENEQPTDTTLGNNAIAVHNLFSNDAFDVGKETATSSATRDYTYSWTNQWFEEKCSPAVFDTPQRNDLDAARANLFAMHNRMHDWSYQLGFTERTWNLQDENFKRGGKQNDLEQGNAQAGGVTGGPPAFAARDNANQITPPDGHAPITNMYLWQPIAGSFYAPCVDGDYDMSVIGHEYGHAISNRMVAGPGSGLSGPQAGAMGESWSDQMAVEYLNEHGYAPSGARAFTVGEYATSDNHAGIRNYNMSDSPLNYSDIAYDLVGQQVHADGEIWSATNFDIRQAFIGRYGAADAALQKSCANGNTPVGSCPGNRRWMQLVFDSYLLMAVGNVSMVDARDALLAADRIRFGGANQDLLWNAFAKRGLGEAALSNTNADPDPRPGFTSPFANEGTLTFAPVDEQGAPVAGAQLFVGRYQGRAVPVADTDGATALGTTVALVPGSYEFTVRAPGRGLVRVGPLTVNSGAAPLNVTMRANLASSASGAAATGDGVNAARLIDDNEATNWASLGSPVAGRQVTVDLAGGMQQVRRVQVSALLRPQITTDADSAAQNRFSALRQFRVLACTAAGPVDCSQAADFDVVFTSAPDAFPSIAPRPRAPELSLKSFTIPTTTATHLRFEAVTNQCTGAPDYAGEQDNDPRAGTDCATNSPQSQIVRAAEFQVFAQ